MSVNDDDDDDHHDDRHDDRHDDDYNSKTSSSTYSCSSNGIRMFVQVGPKEVVVKSPV